MVRSHERGLPPIQPPLPSQSAQLTSPAVCSPPAALARFDGGYNGDQLSALQKLLVAHQPHAAIFNGCQDDGQCVSNTSVRWIGTESGQAPDPNWSTGVSNDGGDPDSPIFCPAECDTTLQDNDRWFYVRHRTDHNASACSAQRCTRPSIPSLRLPRVLACRERVWGCGR